MKKVVNLIGISGKLQSGKNTVASIIQMLTSPNYKNEYLYKVGININRLSDYNFSDSVWQQKAFAGKLKQIVSILTEIPVEDLEKQEVKDRVLGEEWKYWVWTDYKLANNQNIDGIISQPFSTREEAENQKIGTGRVPYYFGGAEIKSKIHTPRTLLQLLGTDCGRQIIHPNIWVNALMSEYKTINNCQQHSDGFFYTDEHGENEVIPIYPNWIITDVRFPNEAEAIKKRGGIIIRVNRKSKFELAVQETVEGKEHASETSLDNYNFDAIIDNNGTIEELIEKVKKVLNDFNI